jgi:hypothetical protein
MPKGQRWAVSTECKTCGWKRAFGSAPTDAELDAIADATAEHLRANPKHDVVARAVAAPTEGAEATP